MSAVGFEDSPVSIETIYCRGLALQEAGDGPAAMAAYEATLDIDPWHVGALLHGSTLALELDRQDTATHLYRELLMLPEEDIASAPELATALPATVWSVVELCDQVEQRSLARTLLEALARRQPEDASLPLAIGRLHMADEQPDAAAKHFERAAQLAPEQSEAWAGLGAALLNKGSIVKARQALEHAVRLDPDDHGARRDLIALLTKQKGEAAAMPHYRELAARVDDDLGVLGQTGLAMLTQKDSAAALDVFRKMLAREPDSFLAALGAGAALIALDEPSLAISRLEHALQHVPRDTAIILSLSRVFAQYLPRHILSALLDASIDISWNDSNALGQVAGEAYSARYGNVAVKGLERLLELMPDDDKILPALIDAKLSVCDWGDGDALSQRVLQTVEERMAEGRALDIDVWNLFAMGVDYPTLARAARYKSAHIEAELAPRRAACAFEAAPRRDRRIRLGYLCPYTFKSSHIDNLLTVVRRHDSSRFALFGYSIMPSTGDVYDKTFMECFEAFRHTPLDRLEDSAKAIHDDGIDILIDSTGHFSASCMRLAAMRPAPVVVHGAAGFNIIGAAPFYDYSLNDRQFLPPEMADLYVEQPFYMPHSAMPAERLAIAPGPASRASFGIPEDTFVFADFNHPCKFDPKSFAAWMTILRQVPDSVLLLGDWVSDTEERLNRLAQANGVDSRRLRFMPYEPRPRHLRRLQFCDLALDTVYHCGGVTTVDCLIAGLPILSVVPDRPLPLANRSLLEAMDLGDLVMPDLRSYIERGVALARAPDELAAIRARMRTAQDTAPLFQAERWVSNLERACEIMFDRHADGDDPAPFSVLDVEDWPTA